MNYLTKMAKLSIFCFFVFSSQAVAWLRPVYEDTVIVERSELIVTGHLVKNSICLLYTSPSPRDRS